MTATEEHALRGLVTQLESAWNRGDSGAWTALFADDADLVHILGGPLTGHTEIERAHRAIFDTVYKGSTLKFTVEKIRPVSSDVAIVFVFGELHIPQPGVPPVLHARPTLVAHQTGGTWKIVTLQNTVVKPEGAPAGNNPLAERLAFALDDTLPSIEHPPRTGTAKAGR